LGTLTKEQLATVKTDVPSGSVKGTSHRQAWATNAINLQAPCVLYIGQAFCYSPENAFYVFNQQIYFIV